TSGTSQLCNDCHQQSFANSINPNHQSLGLNTDCKTCHTTSAWIPSSFNHSSTNFQLTGGHTKITCADCHKGKTTGTDTQCFACHKTDFDGVKDPNHVTANFSNDCTSCHSTTAWTPSTFNHANTKFPITGAHTRATCVQCHASGYTNTSTDCYSCHKAKFDASTNPPHLPAQFPHDCETCHTQTAWSPSTFNHDTKYFPIYSGKHNGEWNLCSDCHTSSSDYKVFSCINCHEHNNKASVDKDHDGVQNYSYVSSECYRCHPQGKDLMQIKNYIKTIENR
ncbi:MAG: cytochrome c3 family protein, partial [Ignavibacteria bacterium]|nr:cytochrome c3 family protein [Ignavibacteria bacterium]